MAAGIVTQPARGEPRPLWGIGLSMLQDALLVLVSLLFAYLHLRAVVVDGTLKSLPFAAEQSLLVFMFLTRRRSIATSSRPLDWLVATGGWTPLLFQPTDSSGAITALGTAIQAAGLLGACVGLLGYL